MLEIASHWRCQIARNLAHVNVLPARQLAGAQPARCCVPKLCALPRVTRCSRAAVRGPSASVTLRRN